MADLRKCIGSTRFGIEAHEAPVADFPVQPSQKDGLGRMRKPHWNQYTTALRKAALAHKAAEVASVGPTEAEPAVAAPVGSGGRKANTAGAAEPEPIRTPAPRGRRKAEPVAEVVPEPVAG